MSLKIIQYPSLGRDDSGASFQIQFLFGAVELFTAKFQPGPLSAI